jgi:NADP-dependent 3-hydroxy acid dehydrogenase YdfG
VYSATKHAVDALTKGMRIDLLPYGIKVTQISPGAVETEFSNVRFKGDTERARQVYKGYEPLRGEDVADIIHFISALPQRVNVNDILVMPQAQANTTIFNKN